MSSAPRCSVQTCWQTIYRGQKWLPIGSTLPSDGLLLFQCCRPNLKHHGQNDFNPTLEDAYEHLKASLKCSPWRPTMARVVPFSWKWIMVSMVLFQWQYQSLCPAMDLDLWVSGINLGVHGCCNAEQLVSPDHHPMHLKGVVVFCKSTVLLHLNTLMVVSPHGLATYADPFQLSLSPEAAFAELTGSLYPLPVLLLGSSYIHFICVWATDAVPRNCVHIGVNHILPRWVSQIRTDHWYSSNFLLQYCHQDHQWPWVRLEGGWVGSCSCCCLKLVPVPSTKLGMSSLPCTELCSLLALTSWESTLVLLLWCSLSELLEEWSCFFCVEMARNSANGHPTRGVPTMGISSKGGTGSGGVLGGWAGLVEGPGANEPSGLDTAWTSSSSCVVVAIILLM